MNANHTHHHSDEPNALPKALEPAVGEPPAAAPHSGHDDHDQHPQKDHQGDHIAPALTRADVGIAVGAGPDGAKSVRLSQHTYRKMVENLWWATGILAPLGIELSPAAGAALMAVSTIVVAINTQTLRGARL